jgi:ATP-binding cassette subfamily C protein
VSHRPAVIRIADQILEVRDGKVLATHHAVDPDGTRADEAKA